MFIIQNNWLTPDPEHDIFDFHLPGYPVVPGAISAGLLHQAYCEQFNRADSVVDIFFHHPITADVSFKILIDFSASELIGSNGKALVKLTPVKLVKKPDLPVLEIKNKITSRLKRAPELLFHHEFVCDDALVQCLIHYENLLMDRPYLFSLKYANYFVVLETMGNLAMELCGTKDQEEIFVFHSFKGVWFDWSRCSGELNITTYARRIGNSMIQWSSQIKNKNKELVGYVSKGLNVKMS